MSKKKKTSKSRFARMKRKTSISKNNLNGKSSNNFGKKSPFNRRVF